MSSLTRTRRTQILALTFALLALTVSFIGWRTARAAGIVYVVPGGAGAQSGADWANAKDLAAALSAATSGDELWVKSGTYKPTTPSGRNATFTLKTGVAVYGGFAGTETLRSQRNANPATNGTVLSGDLNGNDSGFTNNGENSYHVVTGSGTNHTAVLDGFTIRGGNASNEGGGMVNISGSPTLTNVTFSGNSANLGGGGMYNEGSSPTLTNVTFSGNSTSEDSGGGMYNYNSSPALTNVTFSGNSAGFGGGGMYNVSSSPTLTNVTFSGNSAGFFGGGMYNHNSSPTLTNVTFSGNIASNGGGGMANFVGSNPTLTNVTFSGNSTSSGGGMYNNNSSPTLRNSILWGDSGGEIVNANGGTATVSNSVVQGGYAGGTNIITTDPMLAPLGNYGGFTQTMRLLPGSSAIDTGNNAVAPATDQRGVARPQNSIVDIGAVELIQDGSPAMITLTIDPVTNAAGAANELLAAINLANEDPAATTIKLLCGTYTLMERGDPNNYYGFNGLPAITSNVTIQGNGAVIERSSAVGTQSFRLFAVAAQDPTTGAALTTPGSLTLQQVTLRNGVAQGGAGGAAAFGGGGGGGAGLGGAIFNQGTLTVEQSTLTANTAQGGAGGNADGSTGEGGGGGGLGGHGGSGGGSNAGPGGGGFGGNGGLGNNSGGGGEGGGRIANGANAVGVAGGTGGSAEGGDGVVAPQGDGQSGSFGGGGGGGAGGNAGQVFTGSEGGAGGVGGGGGAGGNNGNGGAGGYGGGGGGGGCGGNGGKGAGGGFGGGGGGACTSFSLNVPGAGGGFGGGSGGGFTSNFSPTKYTGGGGGAGLGGAIFNDGGILTVRNSTLSGNTASGGVAGTGQQETAPTPGQGLGGGIFARNGSVTINHVTLNQNSVTNGALLTVANGGGSLYLLGDGATVSFSVTNTILANTTANNSAADAFVNTINSGLATPGTNNNNLVEVNGSVVSMMTANDLPGVTQTADPNLGVLTTANCAASGCRTPVHPITNASPAYNAAGMNSEATDQCGTLRPQVLVSDIGAYEVLATPPGLQAALTDPIVCNGVGGIVIVTAQLTNANAAGPPQAASFTALLPPELSAIANSCTANTGLCQILTPGQVTWNGNLAANQTVTIQYQALVANGTPANQQLCVNSTGTVAGVDKTVQACGTANCPPNNLNNPPTAIGVSSQKAGSVLVYPYYTAKTATKSDTRLTVSNIGDKDAIAHLFFIDGASCQQADFFVCLTANASFSFKASEYDPETTGWLLAVAVDKEGRPVQNNVLIGNAFVTDGNYVDNYGAESFAAKSANVAVLQNNTARLLFNDAGYEAVPDQFAVELQSPLDAAGQRIVTVGLLGDLTTSSLSGAAQVGVGLIVNGNEKPSGSFSALLQGNCQALTTISTTTPRVPGGMATMIPSGQVGTIRFNVGASVGLLLTPRGAANRWNGIRALHKTHTTFSTITIPVLVPVC